MARRRGVKCTSGQRTDFIDTKINSNFLLPRHPATGNKFVLFFSFAASRFRYIPHSCRCRSSQARSTGNRTFFQPINVPTLPLHLSIIVSSHSTFHFVQSCKLNCSSYLSNIVNECVCMVVLFTHYGALF